MAPLIPVFVAIGSAVTAGAATGTAAAVVGGITAAAVVGGTAAVATSMGKAKGAQKAANAMAQNQSALQGGLSDSASREAGGGETGTNKARSLALSNTGSSGVLGNATVGRRTLLAS